MDKNILVVESNKDIANAYRTQLDKTEYNCKIVNDVEQARRLINSAKFNLILVDASFSAKKRGVSLLRYIRRKKKLKGQLVLVTTYKPDVKMLAKIRSLRPDLILDKNTYRPSELVKHITGLVEKESPINPSWPYESNLSFKEKSVEFGKTLFGGIVGLGILALVVTGSLSGGYDDPASGPSSQELKEMHCNINYDGCVSNSNTDLDCVDVEREVEVIGYDEYGFDEDGDGWGCEYYNYE